mmetsp:Transcript_65800/g.174451  ORF Transcript_65800/g.174451 Transcript_65800/m.174451 type:complete len:339 (-) Transcript_65800:62-1078(-)
MHAGKKCVAASNCQNVTLKQFSANSCAYTLPPTPKTLSEHHPDSPNMARVGKSCCQKTTRPMYHGPQMQQAPMHAITARPSSEPTRWAQLAKSNHVIVHMVCNPTTCAHSRTANRRKPSAREVRRPVAARSPQPIAHASRRATTGTRGNPSPSHLPTHCTNRWDTTVPLTGVVAGSKRHKESTRETCATNCVTPSAPCNPFEPHFAQNENTTLNEQVLRKTTTAKEVQPTAWRTQKPAPPWKGCHNLHPRRSFPTTVCVWAAASAANRTAATESCPVRANEAVGSSQSTKRAADTTANAIEPQHLAPSINDSGTEGLGRLCGMLLINPTRCLDTVQSS